MKALLLGLLLCFLPDDRPIAGVLALFRASAHAGTVDGPCGRHVDLFVAEAVTDESGELRLPKQEFSAQPFFLNTNYQNPSMVLLKPGYVLMILMNNRRVIAELQDVTTWEHNNQTIKLKRATTDNETAEGAEQAALYATQAVGGCAWKNIPRFLLAVDRLAAEWNRKRESVPDATLRLRTARSPLETVLMNDSYYIEKGCGSPRAFFKPREESKP